MGSKEIVKEKIIEVLTNNPDKKWYMVKLANEIGLSPGTVSTYIEKMKGEGKVSIYTLPGSPAKYVKLSEEDASS